MDGQISHNALLLVWLTGIALAVLLIPLGNRVMHAVGGLLYRWAAEPDEYREDQ